MHLDTDKTSIVPLHLSCTIHSATNIMHHTPTLHATSLITLCVTATGCCRTVSLSLSQCIPFLSFSCSLSLVLSLSCSRALSLARRAFSCSALSLSLSLFICFSSFLGQRLMTFPRGLEGRTLKVCHRQLDKCRFSALLQEKLS